jgi:hypothetical protein
MVQEQMLLDQNDYQGGSSLSTSPVISGLVGTNSLGETVSGESYTPPTPVLVKKPYQAPISESREISLGTPIVDVPTTSVIAPETPAPPVSNSGTSVILPNPLDILPKEAPIGVNYGVELPLTDSTIPIYGDGKPIEIVEVPTPVVPNLSNIFTTKPVEVPIQEQVELAPLNQEVPSPVVPNLSNIFTTNPVEVPIQEQVELAPIKESLPVVDNLTNVGTSVIAESPLDVVKKEEPKSVLNILPFKMPTLSPASGGGSSESLKKSNQTYWLYVVAGAVVVSYFLFKGKPSKN